jgi:hypothetical protein
LAAISLEMAATSPDARVHADQDACRSASVHGAAQKAELVRHQDRLSHWDGASKVFLARPVAAAWADPAVVRQSANPVQCPGRAHDCR